MKQQKKAAPAAAVTGFLFLWMYIFLKAYAAKSSVRRLNCICGLPLKMDRPILSPLHRAEL
ncbi:hypothetical protein C2I18_13285 [Paenibacillus sp. PK3_47]|nr:hypothetical protein C2I18_13285 [Paenibacillus sp. PK3_47]